MNSQTLLALLTLNLAVIACNKDKGGSKPAPPPAAVTDPAILQKQCMDRGQTLDGDGRTCRVATLRECLEQNKILSGQYCYKVTSVDKVESTAHIDFAAFCDKNEAGAFVNCRDGEFKLPIGQLPVSEGSPAWLAGAAVDVEQEFSFRLEASENIKITLAQDSEAESLVTPKQGPTTPILVRNIKPEDAIVFKVQFPADVVLNSFSTVNFGKQLVVLNDRKRLAADVKAGTVSARWLRDEIDRQGDNYISKSTLHPEWKKFLKTEVEGPVIWDLNRDCPADQLQMGWTAVCKQDFVVKIDPLWKNKPYFISCDFVGEMKIINNQQPFGLLDAGMLGSDSSELMIEKSNQYLESCFIKVLY